MTAARGSHAQRVRALSGALGDFLSEPGRDLLDAANCAEEFTELPEVRDLLACQPCDTTAAARRAHETPTLLGVRRTPSGGLALAYDHRAPLPGQPVTLDLRRVDTRQSRTRTDVDALADLLALLLPLVRDAGPVAIKARPSTALRVQTVLSAFLEVPVRIVGGGRGA